MLTVLSVVRPPGSWIETLIIATSGKVVSASSPTAATACVTPAASVGGTVMVMLRSEKVSSTRPNCQSL